MRVTFRPGWFLIVKISSEVSLPLRYEFPLTERVRLLMRLEDALGRIRQQADEASCEAHRHALLTLCELLDLTQRIDIRGEVRIEAERQRGVLRSFRNLDAVDAAALELTLDRLNQVIAQLDMSTCRAGSRCRDDSWLSMVRARAAIPGGFTRFDLPSFHFWSALDPASRRDSLLEWLLDFDCVEHGVGALMTLIRACAESESFTSDSGQFHRTLGGRQPIFAVVDMAPDAEVVPEVSANRSTLLLRFMHFPGSGRPRLCDRPVHFGLAVSYLG